MHLQDRHPFELFAEMQRREAIDPAHAFYLGYEKSHPPGKSGGMPQDQ